MQAENAKRHIGRPSLDQKAQEKMRRQIIETAKTLFAEEGIDAVSMRKIAAKSGFSQRLPYLYFKNKQAILRYVWEDFFTDLFEECHYSITGVCGARPRLERFLRTYIDYWLKHPEQYELVFLNKDQIGGPDDTFYVEKFGVAGRYQAFESLVQSCIDEGVIRDADPVLIAQTLVCSVHGLLHCLITVGEYPWKPRQDLVDSTLEVLFSGLHV